MADQEHLIEENRESDVKLGRITAITEQKIKDLNEQEKPEEKKLESYRVIFSIWNTMLGSSILSNPYNVYSAGIIPTILFGILYGLICFLSCSVVVKLSGNEEDFSVVVYNYLFYSQGLKAAKIGKYLQIIFNLLMNIGATFIYFLLINQNLYPCLCLLLRLFNVDLDDSDKTPHFDKFSPFYCALIISALVFPLTIKKEIHFLQKMNSLGVIVVLLILGFIIYVGIDSLARDTFHFEYKENKVGIKDRNLYLFGENPGLITGMYSLGLFSHSFILPYMKNNKNPKNNTRDLFIGYLLVTLTFIIIGLMGYIGFSGSKYSTKFEQNFFLFFPSDDYFAFVLRILSVFQLLTIFPILFFIVRTQLFSTFFKSYNNKTTPIIIFSVVLFFFCFLILIFLYDSLADLIGYIGAGTALILVYTLAPLINMIDYYIRHQPAKEIEKIKEKKDEYLIFINVEDLKPLIPWKAFIFYMGMILIIILGIITLLLQIIPSNLFNIKIEKSG